MTKSDTVKALKNPSPFSWASNGLKFKCTECGKCCTGSPGYVWVTKDEMEKISQFLKISFDLFTRQYVRNVSGKYSLVEYKKNYDCVFLQDGKCSIYPVRPSQCKSYPWWFQNLHSKEAWLEEASRCEGINHPEGKHYSLEEIQALADA